jgi:hypothetical protein
VELTRHLDKERGRWPPDQQIIEAQGRFGHILGGQGKSRRLPFDDRLHECGMPGTRRLRQFPTANYSHAITAYFPLKNMCSIE